MPRPKRPTRSRLSNALTQLGVTDLMAEVQRRREVLTVQLEGIRTQIAELGSLGGSTSPQRRGPGRPKGSRNKTGSRSSRRTASARGNEVSLVERLHSILRGRTMNAPEMVDAVLKAGYKTKSANLRPLISQSLMHNPKRFKRVSRGQYTAR